jgi:hypothetical protein
MEINEGLLLFDKLLREESRQFTQYDYTKKIQINNQTMDNNFKFNMGDTIYYPHLSTHSGVFEIIAGTVTQLSIRQLNNGEVSHTYFTKNFTSVHSKIAFASEQECRDALVSIISNAPFRVPHEKDLILSDEIAEYGS